MGRERVLWLEGDDDPGFESDDELLFSGSDSASFGFESQICSSDDVLFDDFLLDGFSEEEEISPATLPAPEVVVVTVEPEPDDGWRFSTFSAAAAAAIRFLRQIAFGYGDVCHS